MARADVSPCDNDDEVSGTRLVRTASEIWNERELRERAYVVDRRAQLYAEVVTATQEDAVAGDEGGSDLELGVLSVHRCPLSTTLS